MIISKIYNKLNKSQREDLVVGLILGLVGGLIFGLAWGLAGGLVGGLVWGLVVLLLNFSEAFPFIQSIIPIVLIIIGIIIIAEVMFWITKDKKPKKGSLFWHTCIKKSENVFEVLLGISLLSQVYIFTRDIDFIKHFPIILKWVGYIGACLVCVGIIVGIFYLWIKLNELKYR